MSSPELAITRRRLDAVQRLCLLSTLENGLQTRSGQLAGRFDPRPVEVHVEHPGSGGNPSRLEGGLHRGRYPRGVRFGDEGEDGGAGARETGPVGAVRQRRLYNVLEARDEVGTVGLVQAILHRHAQQVVLPRSQGAEEEPGAADIEDGVAVRDPLRQGAAGGCGRDGKVGDGDYGPEALRFEAHRAHALWGEGADDEAAQEGGGGVVGVAVQLADDVEEVWGGDLTPEEVVGGDGPADEGGGAAAQTPGGGDGVILDEAEVGVGLADELGDETGGAVGGVRGSAGDELRACAAHLDAGVRSPVEVHPHAQRERQPYRVVAGAEVRRGGRDADGDQLSRPSPCALRPPRASRGQARAAPGASG